MSTYRICIAAGLLLAGLAHGDVLELEGGESFSGKVVRVVEGTLVFRSSIAGQMMVPMDTVEALATDHFLMLTMKDGAVHYGRIATEAGSDVLVPIGGEAPRPIVLAEIAEALAIPTPPEADASEQDKGRWRSALEAGGLLRQGTETNFDPLARLEVGRVGQTADFDVDLLISTDAGAGFPQYLRGSVIVGGNAPAWAPFLELRADRNLDAALEFRGELSLGVRWPLRATKERSLAAYAGLAAIYEDYDASAARHFWDRDQAGGEAGLHLGLRYSGKRFQEEITLYPSLSGLGDIRIRSSASYTMPFTPRLHLRLDLLVDYDNAPPFPGLSEWEAALGASLRVDF